MKWTETQSKDYLIWSLEGKALDFFASSIDVDRYSFRKMMKKLETRFGVTDLKETVKVEFDHACQEPEESLEDWADRAWTLATHAFADLKEKHRRFLNSAKGVLTKSQLNMLVLRDPQPWKKHWIL